MTLMLLRESGPPLLLVIVKQSGPAVWPTRADPKLIRFRLSVGSPTGPAGEGVVVTGGGGGGVVTGTGVGLGGGVGLGAGPDGSPEP